MKKVTVSGCVRCVNFFLLHIIGKAESKFSGKILTAQSYSTSSMAAYRYRAVSI